MSGSDLDTEFDNLENTLDATLVNLAIIQRDDTKLNNLTVHPDALDATTKALIASSGWNPRGAWVTATAYAVKDFVSEGGNSYVAVTAHTSGTFATDLSNDLWVLVTTNNQAGAVDTRWVDAGGTADAITLTYANPVVTAYTDGAEFHFRATAANATTTPTLNINAVGAKTIVKHGNAALIAGDIVADSHEVIVRYNSANDNFELLNPFVPTTTTYTRTLLDDADADAARATLEVSPFLGEDVETELTISAGSITPTAAIHNVDTESDAAEDDLDNIDTTNLPDGRMLLLRNAVTGRSVTVRNAQGGAGQINTAFTQDYTMDRNDHWILLKRVGADWQEVMRSRDTNRDINMGRLCPHDALLGSPGGDVNTQIAISASGVILFNSNGNPLRVNNFSTTVDITTSGAGGLDTGSESNDVWYYIWAIAQANGTASIIMSLSSTAPTMPTGYTYKGLVSAVFNKGGNFLTYRQFGDEVYFRGEENVLTNGSATSETAVSVANQVPPIAGAFLLHNDYSQITNSGNTVTAHVTIRHTTGQTYMERFSYIIIQGGVTGVGGCGGATAWVPNVNQQFFYFWVVTTGTGPQATYNVIGYRF